MPNTNKNCSHRALVLHFTVVLLSLGAAPALAVDGVIEINHAAVVAGGITPGDSPGYPATLSAPGSYRLTGNLEMPDQNTDGIEISGDFVSVDLNGFSIIGPTVCSGTPVTSCTPTGGGTGIDSDADGTSIFNGVVRGSGQFGVSISGHGGTIDNVRAQDNALNGLTVNAASQDQGGTIRNSNSNRNGNFGIYIGNGGLAEGNVVFGNGSSGIFATEGSNVIGNTMRSNSGFGLSASVGTGFGNNVMTDNNMGNANPQTNGGGVEMGTNVCATNTTCP